MSTEKKIPPVCVRAEDWSALLDRRSKERTWLGADGIYTVALDGNDAYGSADSNTKTFFIFSDSLMGTSDETGFVTWEAGQPSQTSALLTGNEPDADKIVFRWGPGGNGNFGADEHLFGEHKWMLDCFTVGDAIYILGFPERLWKPKQMDMIKIPIVENEPDYASYSKTADIPQLCFWDNTGTYLYAFGIGVMNNISAAGNANSDGYIYFYGYRDAMKEGSRKDLIVARIKGECFPDFSEVTYWNGEDWCDNVEECEVLIRDVSCEMSVSPIPVGPHRGKYIAVFTEATESPKMMYAVGESPVGPFSEPVEFFHAPEDGQKDGGIYTYNAKAHPHLSRDGKLLISYNCNNRHNFGHQTSVEYHPRFLWLDLNSI